MARDCEGHNSFGAHRDASAVIPARTRRLPTESTDAPLRSRAGFQPTPPRSISRFFRRGARVGNDVTGFDAQGRRLTADDYTVHPARVLISAIFPAGRDHRRADHGRTPAPRACRSRQLRRVHGCGVRRGRQRPRGARRAWQRRHARSARALATARLSAARRDAVDANPMVSASDSSDAPWALRPPPRCVGSTGKTWWCAWAVPARATPEP